MFSFIFWSAVIVFVLYIVNRKETEDDDWKDYAWWLPDEWRKKNMRKER